eukprot:gnl/MRDRNA2_/MRDRNA2_161822_c0_seq1.p1 gnl/MRDRNA2_/MRDRNA2_161822_c0~~gnl/MRDRNA2_/MRDRNA2_161822_c0_seq1.p1  ORF type:complete len:261 (-),score=31.63 gnl/MRDRNA2_/MRDRNA2_161822_c0_seq1:175-957(-)
MDGLASLTPEEISHYHEHGYVIPKKFRLPEKFLDAIKDAHARLLKDYEAEHPEFRDYCGQLLPYDLSFLNFARHPGIVNMVSQLIGDDLALWNMSFFAKPAGTGRKVPWHQDGEYWTVRPLATCTVWVAVDRSHSGNGCLRVIPGSHKKTDLLPHTTHNDPKNLALQLETQPGSFDASKAVDLVLEPGQISLHDVFLIHGSEKNTSDHSRRGMTMRFMPTTSVYRRDLDVGWPEGPELPVFLMRGEDKSGKTDFGLFSKL